MVRRTQYVPGQIIELALEDVQVAAHMNAYVLVEAGAGADDRPRILRNQIHVDRIFVDRTQVMVVSCGGKPPRIFDDHDVDALKDEVVTVLARCIGSGEPVVGYVWGNSSWIVGGRKRDEEPELSD